MFNISSPSTIQSTKEITMTNQTAENFANNAWESLNSAVNQFGFYSYNDKGADEVMEVAPFVNQIKSMSLQDAGESLSKLLQKKAPGFDSDLLVRSILHGLEEVVEDSWLDELFEKYDDVYDCY